MSHFTEGVLQAYLDGEVDASARANVDAHVSGCAACADRLRELRELSGTFTSAFKVGEVAAPPVSLEQLQFRSRQRSFADRLVGSRTVLTRAAMLVLGVSFAAAAAVPGSPLQDWLIRTWKSITVTEPQTVQQPQPAERVEPATETGMYKIVPVNGRMEVSLASLANGTRVQVTLADRDTGVVELIGAAADATYSTGAGRGAIQGGGAGEIRITVPRTVAEAIVEMDGKLYVNKVGAELRFHGPAAESVDPDVVFRKQ